MRVLIAPDAFLGQLTAGQAATAMASGWAEQSPGDTVVTCPLSSGGPGFVDAVLAARGGELMSVTVDGPLGEPVPATVLLVPGAQGLTAYVEAAQACGLHLVPEPERDATSSSSAGVGELVEAAVRSGARTVVVATGGVGSHDGGAGMLAALGAGPAALLGRGGAALADLPDGSLGALADVRSQLADVELVLASDVDLPLLGFHGASATEAELRGASPEQAQQLEAALGRFSEVAQRSLVAGRPLTTAGLGVGAQGGGAAGGRGWAGARGAGAGGGLGFALLLLGARQAAAVDVVLEAVGFDDLVAACDLVVTGEQVFGWHSLEDQVVSAVAAAALDRGVPTVVVAGQVEVGRREALGIGVSGAYPVSERPAQVAAARRDPAGALAARTRRVARTWSR